MNMVSSCVFFLTNTPSVSPPVKNQCFPSHHNLFLLPPYSLSMIQITFRRKGVQKVKGYSVNLTETCDGEGLNLTRM